MPPSCSNPLTVFTHEHAAHFLVEHGTSLSRGGGGGGAMQALPINSSVPLSTGKKGRGGGEWIRQGEEVRCVVVAIDTKD